MRITTPRLLILGAGPLQVPAIEKAKTLGCYTITLSNCPTDPGMSIANKSYVCSTTHKEQALAIARSENITGVFTIASEIAAPTAAYIAEKLGLKGFGYQTALNISHKYYLRSFLKEKRLSNIGFAKAGTLAEAQHFFHQLAKPAVLKPVLASGSRGIHIVHTETELANCFPDTLQQAILFEGALLEEFVKGQDIGATLLFQEGELVAQAYSTKFVNEHLVPVAHLFPADLIPAQQANVEELIQKTAEALQLKNGALDADLVITNTEVEIIELGGRLGGNAVAQLAGLHTGTDFITMALAIALGLKVPTIRLACNFVGVHIIGSPANGKLQTLFAFTDRLPHLLPNLIEQRHFAQPGNSVQKLTQSNFQLGYIIFRAENADDLRKVYAEIKSTVWAEVQPD